MVFHAGDLHGRPFGIREDGPLRIYNGDAAFAFFAEIPGSSIGKINILEQQTLVDVPEALVKQVLANAESFRIHRMPVKVEVA